MIKVKQRGLSLVEVMIVLVVVGLFLGASLVSLGTIWRQDAYQSERVKMNSIRDAIRGYLIGHRTPARTVIVNPGIGQRSFTLPAGRPYLPCPDVTGDGIEDRIGDLSLLTLNIVIGGNNDLLANGNCFLSRGSLPWKTLGVPPNDVWGNRYTYGVDDIYSDAIVGFGESTRPDEFDYRHPAVISNTGGIVNVSYERRASHSEGLEVSYGMVASNISVSFTNNRDPIIICNREAFLACRTGMEENLLLDAGIVATSDLTETRRSYNRGDISNGVPYVVVSHGNNARWAIGGDITFNKQQGGNFGFYCRNQIDSLAASNFQHELTNLPFVSGVTATDLLTVGCRAAQSTPNISAKFFANGRRQQTEENYDDIVIWETKSVLDQELFEAEVFPIPDLDVFRP